MKHGPLRWLPVELTLVNDLPINTDVERVRVLFGTTPRFQIYFLDDNTYPRERRVLLGARPVTRRPALQDARPGHQAEADACDGRGRRLTW